LFLNRLNIFLTIVLLACALALVTAQARARKLFVEHERARAQSKQLDVRANELQLQQTQFAKASLIDAKARKEMNMQAVPADRLVHLEQRYPAPTLPATGEAPLAPDLTKPPVTTLSMGGR
jgi:cell division protein FtsL